VEPLDVVKRICFTKSQFAFLMRCVKQLNLRDAQWSTVLRQIVEKEMQSAPRDPKGERRVKKGSFYPDRRRGSDRRRGAKGTSADEVVGQ
jgi:hypothetical protein